MYMRANEFVCLGVCKLVSLFAIACSKDTNGVRASSITDRFIGENPLRAIPNFTAIGINRARLESLCVTFC
jgi:hypothetical protein